MSHENAALYRAQRGDPDFDIAAEPASSNSEGGEGEDEGEGEGEGEHHEAGPTASAGPSTSAGVQEDARDAAPPCCRTPRDHTRAEEESEEDSDSDSDVERMAAPPGPACSLVTFTSCTQSP